MRSGFSLAAAAGTVPAMLDPIIALLIAVTPFGVSSAFTPGPNNAMIAASGATFGFRRSIPHMLGVAFGFPAMYVLIASGLGTALALAPTAQEIVRWVGVVYILWLSWRMAHAGRAAAAEGRSRPLSFLEAAMFQWVNGKAWMIALTAAGAFTRPDLSVWATISVNATVFFLVSLTSIAAWGGFGAAIGAYLKSDAAVRAFNIAMAALLALSVAPLVIEGVKRFL